MPQQGGDQEIDVIEREERIKTLADKALADEYYYSEINEEFSTDELVKAMIKSIVKDTLSIEQVQKALNVYEIVEAFMHEANIQNTMQVYNAVQKSWDGLRVLADCCDVIGYHNPPKEDDNLPEAA